MKIISSKPVIVFFFLSLFLIACKEQKYKPQTSKNEIIGTDSTKAEPAIPALTAIADSGKPYFKVVVYKNNQPFASYEGDWAIALANGDIFNIQFAASKRMLKISHFLVLYFNGVSTGTFPVMASGNEKGKPTLIFTPEVNGNYGIGMGADTGSVVISKYSNKIVSGTINAEGKNENGEVVKIMAAFINVKNNNVAE